MKATRKPLKEALKGIIDTSIPRPFEFPEAQRDLETPIQLSKRDSNTKKEEHNPTNDEEMKTLGRLESQLEAQKSQAMTQGIALEQAERNPLQGVCLDSKRERMQMKRKGLLPKTAGNKWFDLPATPMTPEILAHMKLLHMRALLDRHKGGYRLKSKKFVPPKFFEMGVVIPGPTEHYTAPPKRERGRTLVEAVLADSKLRQRFRNKVARLSTKRGRVAFNRKRAFLRHSTSSKKR